VCERFESEKKKTRFSTGKTPVENRSFAYHIHAARASELSMACAAPLNDNSSHVAISIPS